MPGNKAISTRYWIAGIIWLLGLGLLAILGFWNIESSHADAENRLISEAGRTASQISSLLSSSRAPVAPRSISSIIGAAMEDERVYAVQISTAQGLSAGQRRNYLWEPIPWDDEIAENCVQGIDPIRINGRTEGKVEVWISSRLNTEEETLLAQREKLRFATMAFIWTLAFLLLLWHWGVFRQLRASGQASMAPEDAENKELVLGLGQSENRDPDATGRETWINEGESLAFVQTPKAWPILSGLFRQTFGRAPALVSRLYADGEVAALCHLARMLEQAAPVIGANALETAARELQSSLNDPQSAHSALAVDQCLRILEATLKALAGGAQYKEDISAPEEISQKQEE